MQRTRLKHEDRFWWGRGEMPPLPKVTGGGGACGGTLIESNLFVFSGAQSEAVWKVNRVRRGSEHALQHGWTALFDVPLTVFPESKPLLAHGSGTDSHFLIWH